MNEAQDLICKACHAPLSPAVTVGQKNAYDLLPCPRCASVTVHPFPSVAELTAFYQAYEGTTDYRAKAAKKLRRARRRILRIMKLARGKRFLDVGCNYGFTVKAALDLGLNAKGIDIDATAVSESRRTFSPGAFETVSVETYAGAGNKADIVYTSEVLEHVHDPDSFIGAIATILEKDGVLYLTTPDAGHWRVPRDFSRWKEVNPPEHITYFTRKGIALLLERHGLEILDFTFSLKPGIRLTARRL